MKTSYIVESTTTGYKVRFQTIKPSGKTTSRLIGRTTSMDDVDTIISTHEMGVGHLVTR